MEKTFSFGEIKFTAGGNTSAAVPDPETPFCVALLGDFSGRTSRNVCEPTSIATRRLTLVDRDNFDVVLAKLGPEIRLPLGDKNNPVCSQFSKLDDFHPDWIFQGSPMFQRICEIRSRLSDPATFAAAAEELGIGRSQQAASNSREPESSRPVTATVSRLASGRLLDEVIDQAEARASADRTSSIDELQEFVRRAIQPHLVASVDPRQAEIIAVIDRVIGSQMRALQHTPDFQALEAAWRAVFFLVRRINTNSQLKLYLFDTSKDELAADLGSSSDLRATGIYRLLVERSVGTPGAEPLAVIAGNFTFGPRREDAELLGKLAAVANAAGAPFLAGASPRLLGCASFAATPQPRDWNVLQDVEGTAAWSALRRLREASSIGLVLPRFLLRLPYGKQTNPIESFDFEEMPAAPSHEDYLWGNSALACALLLAQSFSAYGWEMRSGLISEIDGLPLHIYEQNGESELKPCAEALMTNDAAERMLENGVMALASLKGRDAVRLMRFQSIAEPLCGLAGPWSSSVQVTEPKLKKRAHFSEPESGAI
jgi:type VI secretion system protein ImpC